ncbi:MAG: ester cyclase [Anaerolineae bacterium]|nr:ester cyclase [Anaerolineae bacterium]
MSAEQNKAIVRRWFAEMINTNNAGIAEELIDTHYVNHFIPDQTGPAVEQQIMTMFFSAFPDLEGTIEDLFAEGDRVCVRLIWRGTNHGSFNGMPPTGKYVAFGTTNIFRVVNGKIAENWPQVDMMSLMQQLGAIPAPGQ